MAIVLNPLNSSIASGSVGGITYQTWRGRNVVKTKNTLTDPNTTAQQAQRALMTSVSQAWGGTLTARQRQIWRDAAVSVEWTDRLGIRRRPSGYELFTQRNMNRTKQGLSIITEPLPIQTTVSAYAFDTIASGQGDTVRLFLTDFPGALLPNKVQYAIYGPNPSAGRGPEYSKFVTIATADPSTYYLANGLTPNMYYWFRARAADASGELGNPWFEQVLTVPTWKPTDTSSLVCWLAAREGALNNGGGQCSNGEAVRTFPDQSGNGYDFTQLVSANQPTFVTSVINGEPVIRFDNSNDFMDSALNISESPITMVMIWRTPSAILASSASEDILVNDGGDTVRGLVVTGNLTGGETGEIISWGVLQSGAIYGILSKTSIASGAHWHLFQQQATNASIEEDGIVLTTFNFTSGGFDTSLGRDFRNFNRIGINPNGTTDPFGGDLAEIMIFADYSDSELLNDIRGYVSRVYNLTV